MTSLHRKLAFCAATLVAAVGLATAQYHQPQPAMAGAKNAEVPIFALQASSVLPEMQWTDFTTLTSDGQ